LTNLKKKKLPTGHLKTRRNKTRGEPGANIVWKSEFGIDANNNI